MDLVEERQGGGKASVQPQNRVIDDCGEGQVGEDLDEFVPDRGVAVLLVDLVVEAIGPGQ